jgi:ankyrin repeat protein
MVRTRTWRPRRGETALHIVSRGEYDSQEQGVGIARLLLERGVDVNAREKDGWTSLHWAAFKGRVEVAQVLLDHGANAKHGDQRGETALHLVSRGEYDSQEHGVGIARLLLERGVDVHAQTNTFATALHLAAFNGRSRSCSYFSTVVQTRTRRTSKVGHRYTQVSRGKYKSQEHGVGIARLLLERGVDVNARRKNKLHPITLGSFQWEARGRTGASFFFKTKKPFIFRDHRCFLTMVQTQNAENDEGKTPLHLVSQGDYDSQEHGVGIARLLLQRGVDVHAQDKDHDTPLHSAAFSGMLEIARVLLDRGANVNAENKQGRTPLHQVAQGKYDSQERGVGVARLLLERGVDVHAKTKITTLHYTRQPSAGARDRKVAYRPWRKHDRGERARRDTVAPSVTNGEKTNSLPKTVTIATRSIWVPELLTQEPVCI